MCAQDKISHDWHYQNYRITTSTDQMDIKAIHRYLTTSSWAEGIDIETVKISVENSLCFALFDDYCQIGFARIVTDLATFGYLCDVYVLDEWRVVSNIPW